MKETLSEFLARIGSRVHVVCGDESLAFIPDKHRADAYQLSDCRVCGSYSAQQLGFVARPDLDYVESARRHLTAEAAARYAAGDMSSTDDAGHDAIEQGASVVCAERLGL